VNNTTLTISDSTTISKTFTDFILEKPEKIKEKFTIHKLSVKGTMKRREIYREDERDNS